MQTQHFNGKLIHNIYRRTAIPSAMLAIPLAVMALSLPLLPDTTSFLPTRFLTQPLKQASSAYAQSSAALEAGIALYNKGQMQSAIPELKKAVAQSPGSEQANLWLGKALVKQGGDANLAEAKQCFETVIRINPNNQEALFPLAQMLSWDTSQRGRSIELYQRVYQLSGGKPEVAKNLAEVLAWSGRYEEALEVADPIASKYANDASWTATYAFALGMSGRTQDALRVYETNLNARNSSDLMVKEGYALALVKANRTSDAQAIYDSLKPAIEALPSNERTNHRNTMSGLAFELGNYQDSLAYDLAQDPSWVAADKNVQLRMARAYVKLNQASRANEMFYKVYSSGKMTANEKLEYAEYLNTYGQDKSGLVDRLYQEAFQGADPNNPDVKAAKARYLGKRGQGGQAIGLYVDQYTMSTPVDKKQEIIDFLKSQSKANPREVYQAFETLINRNPGDVQLKAAYAEVLSWDPPMRAKSLEIYLDVLAQDPGNREVWQAKIEQVLKWHTPQKEYMGLYQRIFEQFPDNKYVWLSVARVYQEDPARYDDAARIYQNLKQRYPNDPEIKSFEKGQFDGSPQKRSETIAKIEQLRQENPGDANLDVEQAKLLSYDRKYKKALELLDNVLAQDPGNREALIAKGHTLMWSGKKFKGLQIFKDLHAQYPDDPEVTLALAEGYRDIGRYDKAFKLIDAVQEQGGGNSSSSALPEELQNVIPVAYWHSNLSQAEVVYDFSMMPSSMKLSSLSVKTPDSALYANANMDSVATDVQIMKQTVRSVEALQKSNNSALEELEASLQKMQDNVPLQMSVVGNTRGPEPDELHPDFHGELQGGQFTNTFTNAPHFQAGVNASGLASTRSMPAYGDQMSSSDGEMTGAASSPIYTATPTTALGQISRPTSTNYDLDMLNSPEVFENALAMENSILSTLRPMFRGGFSYGFIDGEPTTTRHGSYGWPNQLLVSVTPQFRFRAGITPRKFYLPRSVVTPDSSWQTEYLWGGTWKPLDRLTLDGQMAINHYSQSEHEDITYKAFARYDVNDYMSFRVGGRREYPEIGSLLSTTGFVPHLGNWRNQLIGAARENAVFAEANFRPFRSIDWNWLYEWAAITGQRIPTNYKNQVYQSLGYNFRLSDNHSGRLAYETLYMAFSKYATTGFFDTTAAGTTTPVSSMDPLTGTPPGTRFGGYFSPNWFLLNMWRLDLRGFLFNRHLEYKVGGALGFQAVDTQVGRGSNADISLANGFDAMLLLHATDWLTMYANMDYLDAGGAFNRWRFGGGAMIKPNIPFLSPIFGGPKK